MEGSPLPYVLTLSSFSHPNRNPSIYLDSPPSGHITSLLMRAPPIRACPQHLCASLLPSPNCKSLPLDSLHPAVRALYLCVPLISHTHPMMTSLVKDPYAPLRAVRAPHGAHAPIIRSFVRDFCTLLRAIRTAPHTLPS
jgi:hypothetical protein